MISSSTLPRPASAPRSRASTCAAAGPHRRLPVVLVRPESSLEHCLDSTSSTSMTAPVGRHSAGILIQASSSPARPRPPHPSAPIPRAHPRLRSETRPRPAAPRPPGAAPPLCPPSVSRLVKPAKSSNGRRLRPGRRHRRAGAAPARPGPLRRLGTHTSTRRTYARRRRRRPTAAPPSRKRPPVIALPSHACWSNGILFQPDIGQT